jgi:hypothetical protein
MILPVTSLPQSYLISLRTISWHIGPLLGNDRETDKATTATATYQLRKYATVMESY